MNFRAICLFLSIVWRRIDRADERCPGRLDAKTAWEVARIIWPKRGKVNA